MIAAESTFTLSIEAHEAVAVLHDAPSVGDLGVLVVVGGPQYRVGSHRQFVLFARDAAAAGFPVLRFDYRGMGDSAGLSRDFQQVDDDIRTAVDALVEHSGVSKVVLWCLCDAASAALFYAQTDPRVVGLVLMNPWVHAPETEARARLKTYYGARLRSADLWRKLLRLEFDFRDSLSSMAGYVRRAFSPPNPEDEGNYVERMRSGLEAFRGRVLLVLSGDDLTASEFRELCGNSPTWRTLIADKVDRTVELREANHTFAQANWRDAVTAATLDWLRGLS